MVKLLLGLAQPPTPHDAADALAVAICHLQASTGGVAEEMRQNNLKPQSHLRSWRHRMSIAVLELRCRMSVLGRSQQRLRPRPSAHARGRRERVGPRA